MFRSRHVLAITLVLIATNTASAQTTLELIPHDAAAAFGIRNLDELIKKGDRFIKEADIRMPFRPSQGVDMIFQELGVTQGVDRNRPFLILLVHPKYVKGAQNFQNLSQRFVVLVPFSKLDQMAKNFGLKPGDLQEGSIVKRKQKNNLFGLRLEYVCRHKGHVLIGTDKRALTSVIKSKSLKNDIQAKRHDQLNSQDLLLYVGPKAWPKDWDDFLDEVQRELHRITDKEDKEVVTQFVTSLRHLHYGIVTARIGDGFGLSVFTAFDPKSEPANKFLAAFGNAKQPANLAALPDEHVLIAQAFRGDGSTNVRLAKVFFTAMLESALESNVLVSAANRANLVGVFTEVWQRLKGSRLSVYLNRRELKDGMLSAIGILETADAEEFIATVRQLANLAGVDSIDLSPKNPKNDTAQIEKWITQLNSRIYRIRESAMVKLRLIGEPLLPYLEEVLKKPPNLEVARRAKQLQKEIVQIATARRKELLSNNLFQRLQPSFKFGKPPEKIDGVEVFTAYVQLAKQDKPLIPKFQQFLGPEWNKIRFARLKDEVVVLVGSRLDLLKQTLANMREAKPALAKSKVFDGFRKHAHPNRTIEWHASIRSGMAIVDSNAAANIVKIRENPSVTSVAVTPDEDRLQLDFWMPMEEIKMVAPMIFGP